jgi:phosphopantothenoylcysteine decarboxylase/phosphopantothenate--cysteine ligase
MIRPAGLPPLPLPRDRVLIGGTGALGVSALPTWALALRSWYGVEVRACLTHSAAGLVSPMAVSAACANATLGPEWPANAETVPHLEAAEWADLILVMPATTNFVAKAAHGMADSLLLSIVMNFTGPTVVVQSIPAAARAKAAYRRNAEILAADGYLLPPPQRAISARTGEALEEGVPDLLSVLVWLGAALKDQKGVQAR